MAMQGANTRPIPKDQSLAVILGTSRSSKTSPETSMKITGNSCYLGSDIDMYGITHMYKKTQTQTPVYPPKAGRGAGCPPASARGTDGWYRSLPTLAVCQGMASPPHQDMASVLLLGQHFTLPLGLTLERESKPHVKERKVYCNSFCSKVISNNK